MKVPAWFLGLAVRERLLVGCAAALAAFALLWILALGPFLASQRQARAELAEQREVLGDIERVAARLGSQPASGEQAAAGPATESLVVLVDRTTRAAGLGSHLKRNEPEGEAGIRLRFEDVPFDGLVDWLAGLQSTQAVGVVAATVDPGQAPGRVTANLQLSRASR